jgi:transposase InsO family protein
LRSETLFSSLGQARSVLAAWRRDFNEVRLHSNSETSRRGTQRAMVSLFQA